MVRRHLAGTVGVCLSEEQHDEIMGAVSAIEAERDTLMADNRRTREAIEEARDVLATIGRGTA